MAWHALYHAHLVPTSSKGPNQHVLDVALVPLRPPMPSPCTRTPSLWPQSPALCRPLFCRAACGHARVTTTTSSCEHPPMLVSPLVALAARRGRQPSARTAHGVPYCPLAPSPLPLHRAPLHGYKKPPRAPEANRTAPSSLLHSLHLSAPPGGRSHR